ncbi:hypothetical protein F5884DRAFT_810177 [Xylogone sp. PMI_703]|nr:hypothetical protein F5884DRAFT_810177 [Xylogone sp. PMI_703]
MATSNPQQSILAGKKIVIVGGGIAGLSFAIALRRIWSDKCGAFPDITVYERDSNGYMVGREGYSLSLGSSRGHEGLQTIQRMGLMNEVIDAGVNSLATPGGYVIWDTMWREILRIPVRKRNDVPLSSVRISRLKLRDVLAGAAGDHCQIVWGISCIKAFPTDNGKLSINLSNGDTASCDVLIVAGGSNSKLTTQLNPSAGLSFAGAVLISGTARFSDGLRPPYDKLWGCHIGADDGTLLFVAPVDEKSAFWNLSYRAIVPREALHPPHTPEDLQTILQEARARGKSFGEKLSELIDETDTSTLRVFNALDRKPFPHQSDLLPGIAFIGDANHAVSPFAGNGANLALMDGWDLAECLCMEQSFREGMKMYDERSLQRASKTVDASHRTIRVVHWQIWRWSIVRNIIRCAVYLGLLGKQK